MIKIILRQGEIIFSKPTLVDIEVGFDDEKDSWVCQEGDYLTENVHKRVIESFLLCLRHDLDDVFPLALEAFNDGAEVFASDKETLAERYMISMEFKKE